MEMGESPVTTRKGIDWRVVLQENQGRKNMDLVVGSLVSCVAAWEFAKQEKNIDGLDAAGFDVAIYMATVMSDCLEVGGVDIAPPVVVPDFNLKDREKGAVYRNDETGRWSMIVNGNSLVKAVVELDSGSEKLDSLAWLLFTVSHEMGHVRQKEVLGMSSDGDGEYEVTETVKGYIEGDVSGKIGYVTSRLEVNADAFATRYFKAKQSDFKASSFWRRLDMSEVLRNKWKTTGVCTFAKMVNRFSETIEEFNAATDPGLKRKLKVRLTALAKKARSKEEFFERLDRALDKISGRKVEDEKGRNSLS